MGLVFLVSVNVFSAQLWAETCRKFSPIVYEEVTYIREDVDQSEDVYLPDVLKGAIPERRERDEEEQNLTGAPAPYGTFT